MNKDETGQAKRGETELNEPVLPDDYPIYAGYAYVADGKPFTSERNTTARRMKEMLGASEIRRCGIFGRIEKENLK